MNQGLGGNECDRAHTLTTTTTGSKCSQEEPTIGQEIRTVFCAPQRSLPYRILVLDEVKCKTHTQQSTSSSESSETVNLTEYAPKDTFKAPCCCFENVPNTALTVV